MKIERQYPAKVTEARLLAPALGPAPALPRGADGGIDRGQAEQDDSEPNEFLHRTLAP